jgi:phosphatidylserine/phosphatidylglycerophosphate/cardiolipin synthase-like enzyme
VLSRALAVVALLALVTVAASGGAVGPAEPTAGADRGGFTTGLTNATDRVRPPDSARIAAVYPNPVYEGDRGEYVVVGVPAETNLSEWSVADGETVASLPNETVSGRVAFSADPAAARNLTDARVLGLRGRLELANGGETVELRHGDATVDSATYDRAPEGERFTDGTWEPLGATDHAPVTVDAERAEVFALPDSPDVPIRVISSAENRILLAAYTFESERVVRALERAADRGVDVRVIVDGGPVGGISSRQTAALNRLAESDATVRALGGDRARYDFHHAKYAVVDDRALVLTENWKPSGTGGESNRGWGTLVRDADIASELASVFRSDWDARDAVPWAEYREAVDSVDADASERSSHPERIAPRNVSVERVRLLTAPDNAESEVTAEIAGADESLLIEQVTLGGRDTPPVRAAVSAARRGVRVRVLLSGAWYAEADNREYVRWLNDIADREGLDLEARIAEPRSRYEKIHAKGVVIDEERVVLGSINWNNNSLRENREVAVVLVGEVVGQYYARLFRADWRGGAWRLPVGIGAAVAAAVLAAGLYARRKVAFG